MKIAFFICTLNVGGAENLVLNYMSALKKEGHEVFLIENYQTNSFITDSCLSNNIRIINLSSIKGTGLASRVRRKISLLLFGSKKYNHYINEFQFDVLHFNSFSPLMAKIKFPKNRIFYSIHSSLKRHLDMIGSSGESCLKKMINDGLTIIGTSIESMEEIREHYDPPKLVYIPNGMDFDSICSQRYERSFLKSIDIETDSFVVGHVGRFNKVKNHERIISIFAEIKKRKKNAFLILIGGDDSGRMDLIKKIVSDNGLRSCVRFLGAREDAKSIMGCFDALLFPSLSECMPLTVIEAQVLGVKCVISDVLPTDVKCNSNCVSVNLQENDSVWADAVLSSEAVNLNCHELSIFSINTVLQQLLKVYCGL